MSHQNRLTRIELDMVQHIAKGAAVLGTGGGGDPYIGMLMAERAIREYGPVDVVSLESLKDSDSVFPVAMMGAPTVMVEKLPSDRQFAIAIEALATYLDRPATHVACIEAGGVNSMIPIVAAAQLGLPIVDGDGMGRAFPELQMVLASLAGIKATPLALSDEKGNSAVLNTVTNAWAERLARTATVEMGCSTIISNYPMSGDQTRMSFVNGTLSLCAKLGHEVSEARRTARSAINSIVEILSGAVIGTGRVIDVERRTVAGFARGKARIDTTNGEMTIWFQNEHLIVENQESILVTTPDLIIVVDSDSGEPITTEQLRFGARVTILAAPADSRWHTTAGIEVAGPRYFGYDTDPVRPFNKEN